MLQIYFEKNPGSIVSMDHSRDSGQLSHGCGVMTWTSSQPLSLEETLIFIRLTSEGWNPNGTFKSPAGFESETYVMLNLYHSN